MKNTNPALFSLLLIFLAGCSSYRGAVYSDYNQFALDIRTSEASGAPVQVNLGYDQGVFAYIPKQNGGTNSTQGEAVSAISWNNMATELNPTQISSNSVLKVDAGFITGIAADVASAPAGSQVSIVAATLTNTLQTVGDPGERISSATTALAINAANKDDQYAAQLAHDADDGNGKVSQAKLDKFVKGTLLEGHVGTFYGAATDLLEAKLMGAWSPFIKGMLANDN